MFENLIDKTLTNLNKPNITVSAERCIRKRYHQVECVRCVEYCPVDCIKLGETVEVDFEKCIECGVCVNACPTEVFTHKKLTNNKVMSRLKKYIEGNSPLTKGDRGLFIFACSMAREEGESPPADSVVFPCLGFLNETHLIGVASYGGCRVVLDSSLCNECEFEKGIEIIKKTAASANKLLSAFGKDEMIIIADTIQELESKMLNLKFQIPNPELRTPNSNDVASRREFFSQMKNGTYKMIADSLEDEEIEIEETVGNLPAFLPKRREILIRLLRKTRAPHQPSPQPSPKGRGREGQGGEGIDSLPPPLPNGERIEVRGLNGFPFIRLSIDDKCNFCDMCSTFCPTGAIEKIKTVDDVTLTFNLSKCVNCYPCYNLCHKNAMSQADTMDINKIIDDKGETLISRGMTECVRCEMPFLDYEGKGVCRRCEKLSRFEEGYLSKVKS